MTQKNFFQAVIGKIRREKKMKQSPSREVQVLFHWKIIVISSLVLMVLVFVESFFMYRDISRGEFFPVQKDSESPPALATQDLLLKVVGDFKAKALIFDEFDTSGKVLVDPSR